jgi:plastocyanin
MNMRGRLVLFLAAAFLLGFAPGGEADSQTASTITIQTFQFKPKQIEVKAGTAVTWINQDDIRHTVTSGTPENRDGRFDQPLAAGGKFTFTFTQPGTYTFFCDRHQHMRGEIHVK